MPQFIMLSERIRKVIYALGVGSFSRWRKVLPLAVAIIGLVVLYDLNTHRGCNSAEAMAAAPLARNLAEGRAIQRNSSGLSAVIGWRFCFLAG